MNQSTQITFKNLTLNDVVQNLNYFKQSTLAMSNYSAAFRFMWCRPLGMQFAIINNCLVFKCTFGNRTYFNYPMSLCEKDEDGALDLIENYCLSHYIKLRFSAIPSHKMQKMVDRYGANMQVFNNRKWRDYLYNANDFITYFGKKFAGQRNHVNKFKRLYNYEYSVLTAADEREIFAFLKRFESRQLSKDSEMAEEELLGVYQVLPYIDMLGLKAGAIKIDGKICALSIGEKCGDQIIIHVEKALLEFEGIYPLMAQEFAKHNAIGGILYINREDDSGDRGLRKSKLNYNPICLVDKYDIHPLTVLDGTKELPKIACERVVLKGIDDDSAEDFYRLEYDEERNKYWGYNWREHAKVKASPQYFLNGIRQDFANRWEMPLGIYLNNTNSLSMQSASPVNNMSSSQGEIACQLSKSTKLTVQEDLTEAKGVVGSQSNVVNISKNSSSSLSEEASLFNVLTAQCNIASQPIVSISQRKINKLIGEVVLHNFNYKAECEIGVRLLPEHEGAGYANEALKNLINYALIELNIETVRAKCFKQNLRSKKSLESAGMRYVDEDETYFYFSITAKQ